MYNNWGYSVPGELIERLSQKPFSDYLKEAVLDPPGLTNTTTSPVFDDDLDFAEAYAALQDSKIIPLPRTLLFKKSIFEPAGGMYSTVNDLLKYAKAVLHGLENPQASPLKDMKTLFSKQIPLDSSQSDSPSYGFGWIETQLPGTVGLQGDNAELFTRDELPTLGTGSPPMLTYYHQGAALGYYSAIFTFPETRSAVVVLTNSAPLSDAADWIAQVIVSALFNFSGQEDYVQLAKEATRRKVSNVASMMSKIEAIKRDHPTTPRALATYVGTYVNDIGNFRIVIRPHPLNSECLELSFQGLDTQVYELRHLRNHTFEWALDYNQQARRGRFAIWDAEYFGIDFVVGESGHANALKWAKNLVLVREGIPMNTAPTDEGDSSINEERTTSDTPESRLLQGEGEL